MNENIDLTKILKDCPKGTKFYSYIFGEETYFQGISLYEGNPIPIHICGEFGKYDNFYLSRKGHPFCDEYGECCIFPSKDQRDWSKFKAPWYKKERFDPKTLNPFDKILVQRYDNVWIANFLSNFYTVINPDNPDIRYLEFITITNGEYRHCIPYNDSTKYLVGTIEEAPEYYRYWED